VLRVFSKPSGRYRSKAPCGLQVKGLNDTALRAPPWPSRMAVDQSGPPVGLDLPTPGFTAWYGCDHSNGPDGQGSASRGATAHPGRPWSSLVSTTGSIEPPSERVNAGAFSRIGPIEILVAVLWMRDTRRGPECGPRVPQGF
jgi:hypothetical protein